MKKTKGKHFINKRRRIILTPRFYALMIVLTSIISIFIFKKLGEQDMTGPVFGILFGLYAYICTFGEDK